MTPGFRIIGRQYQRAPDLVAAFSALPVANISDCMARMFAGGACLKPMHAGNPMAGQALTVRTRPGDNLMLHRAIDMAEPGEVIVVDAGGELTNSILGELIVARAVQRQLGGIVVDGAIRDAATIRAGTFPIFAAGITHRGPYKDGPGEINSPVAVDGMIVRPGDIVVGDADGVLSVPLDLASDILSAAQAKNAAEQVEMESIKAGTIDRTWVEELLKARGCHLG